MPPILLAHAIGENSYAEPVANALRSAGYNVVYEGAVLVGESLIQEASKALEIGSPVVLCGTIAALGTGWAHHVVNAARRYSGVRIFPLQMEKSAYVQLLALDEHVAAYWQDPNKAITELLNALQKYYPPESGIAIDSHAGQLERRYCDLALHTYDIVDLANLPVTDPNLATRELLLRSLYVAIRVNIESLPDPRSPRATLNAIKSERRPVLSRHEQSEETRRWSVGERLTVSHRLVVLGDPGAGKSTLLRWIATAYCLRLTADPDWQQLPDITDLPNEELLPILIQCRDLDKRESAQSLERILDRHLRKLGITGTEAEQLNKQLLARLSEGRAILLIDGLDEIVRPATRALFCRQIEQMHVAYRRAPIIVTSRKVGYREMGLRIGRGFEHANILDLTTKDKDDFARRWCSLTEPIARRRDATRELIRAIHSTDRIERLTGNPMLLTTMALVKKKVGKLPSKRAELYREAVDVLLNWRSDIDEPLDPDEALPQLEYVAYAMCASGVQRLRSDEITRLLSNMRSEYPSIRAARRHDPLDFLRRLERRTGILVEIGRIRYQGEHVPVYEFRHLTFQEYLASLALVKGRFPGRNRGLTIAENILPLAAQISTPSTDKAEDDDDVTISENWREVLRLCVMSCDDDHVDSLLSAIAGIHGSDENTSADVDANSRPRIMLAVACLSDEPNVSQDVAMMLIDRFIGVLREADRTVRSVAGRTIGGSSAGRLIGEIGASSWGSDFTRRLVVAWLSAPDHDSLLGACAARAGGQLAADDNRGLRMWLSQQRVQLSNADSIERICAALSIMEVAFEARRNFRQLKPAMIPVLKPKLMKMLDRGGREADAAAWAISWLVRGQDDEDGKERKEPIFTLSVEEESDLVARITNPQTTTLTAQFLTLSLTYDHSENLRLAEAIANTIPKSNQHHIGSLTRSYKRLFPGYAEPIVPLVDHSSPMVRTAVIQLLGRLGDSRTVELFIALLTDIDGGIREIAADALSDLGDARAVEPLIGALVGPDGQVNEAAVMALGDLGDARAVEPLIGALVGPDGQLNEDAATALGRLRNSRAVEPLIGALVGPDGQVNEAAAMALGDLRDARAVEPLIGALVRPDGQVNWSVAAALGDLRDARAVEPLIGALIKPDGQINEVVAAALGDLGDARAVDPLIGVLVGPDGQVSHETAMALGRLGDPRAVEPLIAAKNKGKLTAPSGVVAALATLGDSSALQEFKNLMESTSSRVRQGAFWTLARCEQSAYDRILLSRDADGIPPGLDLEHEIGFKEAERYARATNLPLQDVRMRYVQLQRKYPLRLNW
jgi:HEAT repeat protein